MFAYCLNNPVNFIDPDGFRAVALPPPMMVMNPYCNVSAGWLASQTSTAPAIGHQIREQTYYSPGTTHHLGPVGSMTTGGTRTTITTGTTGRLMTTYTHTSLSGSQSQGINVGRAGLSSSGWSDFGFSHSFPMDYGSLSINTSLRLADNRIRTEVAYTVVVQMSPHSTQSFTGFAYIEANAALVAAGIAIICLASLAVAAAASAKKAAAAAGGTTGGGIPQFGPGFAPGIG